MARGDIKWWPGPIVEAHYKTLVDAQTGNTRVRDVLQVALIPVVAGLVALALHLKISFGLSVGLLTVTGLLSAFLFGLVIAIAARAMEWVDASPSPGLATSQQAVFLDELSANASYGSLVSMIAAVAFVACSATAGRALLAASCCGVVLGVHLVMTQVMVTRRVFFLTKGRLIVARIACRTEADRTESATGAVQSRAGGSKD